MDCVNYLIVFHYRMPFESISFPHAMFVPVSARNFCGVFEAYSRIVLGRHTGWIVCLKIDHNP